MSKPYTPPAVPRSLITLTLIPCLRQPASRQVPFIFFFLSLSCVARLFLVSLFLSFSLPSLFFFIIKCCHNVPCCATQIIYSCERVLVLLMLRGGPSRAPLVHTHIHTHIKRHTGESSVLLHDRACIAMPQVRMHVRL